MYKNIPLSINNTNNSNNTNIGFNLRRQTQTQTKVAQTQTTTVKIIDLFATRYIENIATALANILRSCGIEVFIHIRQVTNSDIKTCQSNPGHFLFICCPQTLLQAKNGPMYPTSLLPLPVNKYFLYQLEQLDTSSHTFMNANIINLFKYAKHTFDYSQTNLLYYPKEIQWNVSFLLPPIVEYNEKYKPNEEKIYDIMFCGYSNARREKIINDLRYAGYNVLHTTHVFGPALTKLIKQSKIFLNIHNNETSKVLETCRLNEAVMASTTHILSEKGDTDHLYTDRVHFITDTKDIMCTVKTLLENNTNEQLLIKSFNREEWNARIKNQLGYIYKEPLLVICNNLGGGSFKFITDISICYKVPIIFIKSKKELFTCNINSRTIIIIQSFLFTDLEVDMLIFMHKQTQCKILLPIHDWYWFIYPYLNKYDNLNHQLYLYNFTVPAKTRELFSICDKIICPSTFVYDIIHNKFPTSTNIIMQEWLDYDYKAYVNEQPNVPPTLLNNKINIGIFNTYITYKGKESIDYLVQTYPDVNFYIVGKNIPMYKETEFFSYIEKYNIHGLLYLNKWGETYCYSLTKGLMSGLPILYNNFGSFTERIPLMEKYIINCSKETEYENKTLLEINFKKLLEYISTHQGVYIKKNYDLTINTNLLFDSIFCV
jgi:hypothetical protein